ncbi:MAG: ADP-ribosylglycohydrolase family protein [Thiohalocapsa sp.]|uniref:ADP-ribosylglycohydrolase family protein n=1 Tax=Thiohalocapsa sp. TaxID=2497641 RepID=UPI0025CD3BE7|nr:ADP-ribosylglycohydrolase family protein [Thiohalocapsa sp.]MCG6942357.1 ADP-ribosylglycohydrolase family protein [Thiohalocapsa sp.]
MGNTVDRQATATRERFRGCLMGLAAGDALGTTLEFKPPGSFRPIDDMVGGGPFRLAPGEWTDDTSMALCLAESVLENGGFDAADQMRRYLRWRDAGRLSSNGRCFDIGNTVGAALARFEHSGDPFAGSDHPRSAGNGSLMRLAPVPMRWASDPAAAIRWAADSSRTTHAARTCIDACRYMAGLIAGALAGEPKEALLAPRYSPVPGLWDDAPLCAEVDAVATGSFRAKAPPEIRGTGYVVDALEAALWAFAATDGFEQGALAAVNLGDDADTTGAIYGQLAGAHYGLEAIPAHWRRRLALSDAILDFADRLYAAATA